MGIIYVHSQHVRWHYNPWKTGTLSLSVWISSIQPEKILGKHIWCQWMNKNYGPSERPESQGAKKNFCIFCPPRNDCSSLMIQTKCQLLFTLRCNWDRHRLWSQPERYSNLFCTITGQVILSDKWTWALVSTSVKMADKGIFQRYGKNDQKCLLKL